MGYTVDGKNLMLNNLGAAITHVGLLDDAGVEISGGGYARQPITWNPADNGILTASNQPSFIVPQDSIISKVIFVSAITGGVIYAETDATGEIAYTINSTDLDLNG